MILAYVPEEGTTAPDANKDYIDQMKTIYMIEPETIEKVNWVLVFAGTIGTILSVIAIVGWIYKFIMFLVYCSLGRRSLKDTQFWIRMLGSFLVITVFVTGVIFAFGSSLYDLLLMWVKK